MASLLMLHYFVGSWWNCC